MPDRPEPLRSSAWLVIGLAGSPRAGGNSDTLLSACLEGARAAGARTESVFVRELHVAPCLECLRCREGGECPQADDAPAALARLAAADLLVVAAPVFFCAVPAQLKALIDRAQPLWLKRLPPDHPRRQWRGAFYVATAAARQSEMFAGARQSVRCFTATLGRTWLGELLAGGLEERGAAEADKRLLRQARSEGRRLVRELEGRRRRLRQEWVEAEAEEMAHAGEIPEVALHGAVFALEQSPEGPGLTLTAPERRRLTRAALERYQRIIVRDLTFRNRRFAVFRAVSRAAINYERMTDFARRHQLRVGRDFRAQAAAQLTAYLAAEISSGWRCRTIDVGYGELSRFARRLGADLTPFEAAFEELFGRAPLHWEETQRLAFLATTSLYPFKYWRRTNECVEIGVVSEGGEEAPQRVRLPVGPDPEAALARARAIYESIPKPERPPAP